MSTIPPTWAYVSVLDIADLLRGVTYNKATASDTPFPSSIAVIRATNIIDRGFDLSQLVYVPAECASASQLIKKGDVVVATSSGSIDVVGKAAQAINDMNMAFGAFCGLLRPSGSIDSRFFGHFFNSAEYRNTVSAMAQGININNLKREHFASLTFPLAPLAEQKRIADKLDVLVTSSDRCSVSLDRLAKVLTRLREATLAAAISGRLTEEWRASNEQISAADTLQESTSRTQPKKIARAARPSSAQGFAVDADLLARPLPETWTYVRASEVVESDADIVYGIVQPGPKLDAGIPYVRGKDIHRGRILVAQLLKTSPEIAGRYARSSIKAGDVLLGIIRATKVAIVPHGLDGANITQGTARFRPGAAIRSRYLAAVLEAPATQRWLHAHYRGIDMPGLNLADVRRVPIPVPPLLEQDEILRRLDRLGSICDQIESHHASASRVLDMLAPAVMSKAFRAVLVPQNSSDEPAAALLERINSTRESRPVRRRRTTRV